MSRKKVTFATFKHFMKVCELHSEKWRNVKLQNAFFSVFSVTRISNVRLFCFYKISIYEQIWIQEKILQFKHMHHHFLPSHKTIPLPLNPFCSIDGSDFSHWTVGWASRNSINVMLRPSLVGRQRSAAVHLRRSIALGGDVRRLAWWIDWVMDKDALAKRRPLTATVLRRHRGHVLPRCGYRTRTRWAWTSQLRRCSGRSWEWARVSVRAVLLLICLIRRISRWVHCRLWLRTTLVADRYGGNLGWKARRCCIAVCSVVVIRRQSMRLCWTIVVRGWRRCRQRRGQWTSGCSWRRRSAANRNALDVTDLGSLTNCCPRMRR